MKWLVLADDPARPELVCDECKRTPGPREKVEFRADPVWTNPAILCPACRVVVHDRAGAKAATMVAAWKQARRNA
jgi:hypothetical protein